MSATVMSAYSRRFAGDVLRPALGAGRVSEGLRLVVKLKGGGSSGDRGGNLLANNENGDACYRQTGSTVCTCVKTARTSRGRRWCATPDVPVVQASLS